MIMRYAIAIVSGIVICFGLLFVMQIMIITGKETMTESRSRHFVDFIRVPKQQIVQTKDRKPKKPPEPAEPPPEAPPPQQDSLDPSADAISIAAVPVMASIEVGGIGIAASDGDYLPIVKVAPIYPRRAQSRGIEGYVIVEFTVTKTGAVRDPVIIESTSTLFERAALKAALKFKYKPRVVDGEAIEVAGVRNKITFQLED